MLVVYETKMVLSDIDEKTLENIKKQGHRVAKVTDLVINYDTDGNQFCKISEEQIEAGMEEIRKWLYANVTDPLFLKYQRGEFTVDEWQSEVAKIKRDWAYEASN